MKRPRGLWRWLAVPVVAAMVWVGAVNTLLIVDEIRYGMASLDWPSTTGTVESSRLEVRTGRNYRRIPHIVYRYQFDGRLLYASRVGASSQHDQAASLVARWRPATRVQVYYDPATGMPALVRGYNRGAWFLLALMLGLTAVPVILLVVGVRSVIAARRAQLPP